mgnify:FL=1
MFVELGGLYVDGLVHVSGLGDDYFVHDPEHQAMIGERTGKVFRLGEQVRVTVSGVNLEQRKIDLQMLQGRPKPKKRMDLDELTELEMQLAQLPPMELGGRVKPKARPDREGQKAPADEEWDNKPKKKSGKKKDVQKVKAKAKAKKSRPKKAGKKADGASSSATPKKSSAVKKATGTKAKNTKPKTKKKKSNAKARVRD